MLEVSRQTRADAVLFTLRGRLDGPGAQVLDSALQDQAGPERLWIIDLQAVPYLSSAGLRILLKYVRQRQQARGEIILNAPNPDVQSVLEVTGMLPFFRVTDHLAAAWAAASRENAQIELPLAGRCATLQIPERGSGPVDVWTSVNGDRDPGRADSRALPAEPLLLRGVDLPLGLGFGALGTEAGDQPELSAWGPLFVLPHLAAVLPADGYNQADFQIKPGAETLIYARSALGLSETALTRCDLPSGPALPLQAWLSEVYTALLDSQLTGPQQEPLQTPSTAVSSVAAPAPENVPSSSAPVLAALVVADLETGSGGYFAQLRDYLDQQLTTRTIDKPATVIWLGLLGPARSDILHQLESLLPVRLPADTSWFCQGQAMTVNRRLAWQRIEQPAGIAENCSDLESLDDCLVTDGNLQVSGGRAWLWLIDQVRAGAEKQLQIEWTRPVPFPREWEVITRRLFADASRVVLDPLSGGYSAGKPFRVTAFDHHQRKMLPTVLKIGPTELINREISNHQRYVQNYILNNSTTLMGQASFGQSSGMRFNFLGINGPDSQLTWLTNRYRTGQIEDLQRLFERIFTSILKPWYGQPRWEAVRLYQQHDPRNLFGDLLQQAEQNLGISADEPQLACPPLGITLPNPYYFLKHEYPARRNQAQLWYTGITHGDLNMQNILLDERDNVYIIDFSETGIRNIVADFARLEPIFKFEMLRLQDERDVHDYLIFEQALAGLDSLVQAPPWLYPGDDPAMGKAFALITQLRRYAKTAVIFETDMIPYLLAVLEWTYPIVLYRQISPLVRWAAAYSAGLIVAQIQRLEQQAKSDTAN